MQILALDHDQPIRPRAREHEARQLQTRESVKIACDFFLSVFLHGKVRKCKWNKEGPTPWLGLADQQSTKVFFISISISLQFHFLM